MLCVTCSSMCCFCDLCFPRDFRTYVRTYVNFRKTSRTFPEKLTRASSRKAWKFDIDPEKFTSRNFPDQHWGYAALHTYRCFGFEGELRSRRKAFVEAKHLSRVADIGRLRRGDQDMSRKFWQMYLGSWHEAAMLAASDLEPHLLYRRVFIQNNHIKICISLHMLRAYILYTSMCIMYVYMYLYVCIPLCIYIYIMYIYLVFWGEAWPCKKSIFL